MAVVRDSRRCGNTTRQIDEWIQEFFDKGQATIIDHAHKEINMANTIAIFTLKKRLLSEHELVDKKDYVIKGKILVRLLSEEQLNDTGGTVEYRGHIITKLGKGFYFNGLGIPTWKMVTGVIDNLENNKKNEQL